MYYNDRSCPQNMIPRDTMTVTLSAALTSEYHDTEHKDSRQAVESEMKLHTGKVTPVQWNQGIYTVTDVYLYTTVAMSRLVHLFLGVTNYNEI